MNRVTYRELQGHEVDLLGSIDRSEHVDGIYRKLNGRLLLEETRQTVAAWQSSELVAYASRLQALIASGGRVHAAWDEGRLIGVGSLDVSGVGGARTVLKLDMLYVSAEHRGLGIGRRLTETVADQARLLGATSLYISATPTRGTVDAYVRMGAELLDSPDPELFEQEPEDIHLAIPLV